MVSKEILKKVKQIQIKSNRIVNNLLIGEYHSAFKGQGIEFEGVREYQPGDEIRTIDWNVTARTGIPHVKYFVEERELTVMLLVDISGSSKFGTIDIMKNELIAELCSILAFSAINNKDKVGLILFSDTIEKYIPPKKGKKHVLRVIRELLTAKSTGTSTNVKAALEHLNRVQKKKSVVFLVSDFIWDNMYEKNIALTNKKHDLTAFKIIDPVEISIPDIGFVELEDSETGEIILVDTSDKSLRKNYENLYKGESSDIKKIFRSINVDFLEIVSGDNYFKQILNFFHLRGKRR